MIWLTQFKEVDILKPIISLYFMDKNQIENSRKASSKHYSRIKLQKLIA